MPALVPRVVSERPPFRILPLIVTVLQSFVETIVSENLCFSLESGPQGGLALPAIPSNGKLLPLNCLQPWTAPPLQGVEWLVGQGRKPLWPLELREACWRRV